MRVPPLTVTAPVAVLEPVRRTVPVPVLFKAPDPVRVPASVIAPVPPNVSAYPEAVIVPLIVNTPPPALVQLCAELRITGGAKDKAPAVALTEIPDAPSVSEYPPTSSRFIAAVEVALNPAILIFAPRVIADWLAREDESADKINVVAVVGSPAVVELPLEVLDQFAAVHAVGLNTDLPPTQYADTSGRSALVVIWSEPADINQSYSKGGVFKST